MSGKEVRGIFNLGDFFAMKCVYRTNRYYILCQGIVIRSDYSQNYCNQKGKIKRYKIVLTHCLRCLVLFHRRGPIRFALRCGEIHLYIGYKNYRY